MNTTTVKSRKHYRSARASRWAWNNSPDGLRNRRAKADARREAAAAALSPVSDEPAPGDEWVTVTIAGPAGVLHSRTLYVPSRGHRCDQHCDVGGRVVTATEVARWVREVLPSRPSHAQRAECRRGIGCAVAGGMWAPNCTT